MRLTAGFGSPIHQRKVPHHAAHTALAASVETDIGTAPSHTFAARSVLLVVDLAQDIMFTLPNPFTGDCVSGAGVRLKPIHTSTSTMTGNIGGTCLSAHLLLFVSLLSCPDHFSRHSGTIFCLAGTLLIPCNPYFRC